MILLPVKTTDNFVSLKLLSIFTGKSNIEEFGLLMEQIEGNECCSWEYFGQHN